MYVLDMKEQNYCFTLIIVNNFMLPTVISITILLGISMPSEHIDHVN